MSQSPLVASQPLSGLFLILTATQSPTRDENGQTVQLFAYQFIRDILINKPEGGHVPVPTHGYGAIKKELERKMNGLKAEERI